jgi:murein DD-endopeptidase MepM/ murein hydrolase activator NlpD
MFLDNDCRNTIPARNGVLGNNKSFWYLLNVILVVLLFCLPAATYAQVEQPDGPVYIVESGDSLWDIAQRFGVSIDELSAANGITNINQLYEGQQLIIPGLGGIQGVLVTKPVSYGESVKSLSRRYQIDPEMLARLNRITHPEELYVGYSLVLTDEYIPAPDMARTTLIPGSSLLELAVLEGVNQWEFVETNKLDGTWSTIPGDALLFPGDEVDGPSALPGMVQRVEVAPLPLEQGRSGVMAVTGDEGLSLMGFLMGNKLNFFQDQAGSYVALQGVHAMSEPGFYPLELEGMSEDGTSFSFSQRVYVRSINYLYDRPLKVDPATIDPAVTGPEDAQWTALASTATFDRAWEGVFNLPSPLPVDYCLETNDCWSSRFGNRRSYNGSEYTSFHTGLDIVGGSGTEIYAPAPGVVVFAGPLTVRGNATMIDHGWGVYTGYMHQSEILVEIGDVVEAGELIGLVGGTGRVEGPHLHWEVWVGGIQVDPLDWLKQAYP